jgi:hypothetical protein
VKRPTPLQIFLTGVFFVAAYVGISTQVYEFTHGGNLPGQGTR